MILRQLTSAVLAMILVTIAVHLWSIFAPVTAFMKASTWERDETTLSARVTGYKWNGCDIVKGSQVGWERVAGEWVETPFQFINDTSPDSTRPADYQRQSFGRWMWSVSNPYHPVRTTVQHECNGELRTTVIGPFRYES